jgi:RNA polymerase sigma factor (TIGR02999 family)
MATPGNVTALLQAWSRGETAAFEKLFPLVQAELRRLAKHYLRQERSGHTLQTTALINEAYIKLVGQSPIQWQNRSHFYVIAARCMRRILIDYARTQHRDKRGGRSQRVELSDNPIMSEGKSEELIALDLALFKLGRIDERKCNIIELQHFGGYSIPEIAEFLNLSETTISRDLRAARAWLFRELRAS